jgi:hypothetical protein
MGRVAKLFLAVSLILLPLSASAFFDKEPGKFKEFVGKDYVDLCTSVVEITTIGAAEGVYWDVEEGRFVKRRGSFTLAGSGFILGKYVITAAHVVEPKQVVIRLNRYSFYVTKVASILDRTITIGGPLGWIRGWIYHLDPDADVAVLRADLTPAFHSLNYRPFWSKRLRKGDCLATIVRKRNPDGSTQPWYEVRYGRVISPNPIVSDKSLALWLPWFNMNDFTMSIKAYGGDSGSPVFAFYKGEPVLVGILRAKANLAPFWSYAARTDFVKRVLDAE